MNDETSISNRQFNDEEFEQWWKSLGDHIPRDKRTLAKMAWDQNSLSRNLGKWLGAIDTDLKEGLATIARAIAERDSTTLATGKLKDARTPLEDAVEANKS